MTAPDLPAQAGEADSGADAADPASGMPRRNLLMLGLAGLGLLLLVALGVLLLLLGSTDDSAAQEPPVVRADEREDVLRAARQSALNLTSIDNREFAADVQRVLEGATGAFRADFEARSQDLEAVLTENQVVSEGSVIEAALVELQEDGTAAPSALPCPAEACATALVVVDSNVRNTAVPEGRVNTYRMKLQLERFDGQWLTSMLEFVG